MPNEIAVALLALVGTLVGSFAGIMTSNKLTNYRIQELEKRVDKHNQVADRMIAVEASLKSAHHRIDEIHGELHGEGRP